MKDGWRFEFFDSGRAGDIHIFPNSLDRLREVAAQHSPAHILGFSKRDGSARAGVRDALKRSFRFRWLDNAILSHLSRATDELCKRLCSVLDEEYAWAQHVQPTDIAHPLILPVPSFGCSGNYRSIWTEEVFAFGDAGVHVALGGKLAAFERSYWLHHDSGSTWRDDSGLVFNHRGARHGKAPRWRDWKHSFAIPDGFHFDVTSPRGSFSIVDSNGTAHLRRTSEHLNIDPHGVVR